MDGRMPWAGLMLVASMLTGCTSFYGSSILGHDAIDIPFQETTREKLSLGFVARTSSLSSQYTLDSTSFWQAGPLVTWSRPWADKTVIGSLAFSAYQAKTTLHHPSDQILEGRGWTIETKDGVLVPMGWLRALVAFDGVINREDGDYRVYRATLDNARSVDLSPHGLSGEVGITAGLVLPIVSEVSLTGEWHNGISSPDLVLHDTLLPGSSTTLRLKVFPFSVSYTASVLSVLNRGNTLQVTVQF